jgi:ABC-type sugar transport system substrate-binding protein
VEEPVAGSAIPEGATEIVPEGDLTTWAGKKVGIANLAPVPGAERFTKIVQACVEANGGTADYQDVGGDPTKLPAILENWISEGVSAVFNAGIDMTGIESLIGQANDANIPILTWGAGNPEGVINLAPEVTEEGRNWGRYLIDALGGEGDVLLVTAQNPALVSREEGLKEVLEGTNIKLTVTGDPLGFSVEAAQKATETALQANPNIKAVIGAFGSLGVGAAIAVKAANSDAIVLGANGDPEEYDAIRSDGPFKMTLAGGHEFGGEAACKIAAGILGGGSVPGTVGKEIFTTSVIVTADNVPAEGKPEATPRKLYQQP